MTALLLFLINHIPYSFKRLNRAFQDAVEVCKEDSVVGYGDILVFAAAHAVEDFSFRKHTSAAVDYHLVFADIIRELGS